MTDEQSPVSIASMIGDFQTLVNTSGEESKYGIVPEETMDFFNKAVLYPNISITGLMTIAPEVDDPEKARPYFRRLHELRDEINRLRTTDYRLRTIDYLIRLFLIVSFHLS